ncbi:hypothetical protein EST38_g6990 [Candolleomyces aberdarensis]|uniref:MaoC-like domain-containing protein n=1 Tax=Candolleomyces aberdarensis TaxID=2316362 RepID=A0A4Q2DGG1_9AGAR|nr:hypothetical protein EST38_g6990 [Candolleomyces aberdarensis]
MPLISHPLSLIVHLPTISGDFNPIHVNPYFLDYASLPATITHGLWSSAATRRYVETVVPKGHPERVIAHNVSFVGMVILSDELSIKSRHVGMPDRNIVVNAARRLWLLDPRNRQGQPKGKDHPFWWYKGQAIRQCYMDMTYHAMDKDGHVKTLPLFADIDI